MSVKLRKKTLSTGKISLYLDVYTSGKRHYEFLQLYLHNRPREESKRDENRETMQLAEEILAKRQREVSGTANDVEVKKKPTEVIPFFEALMDDLKSKGRESYWEVHKFTVKALQRFIRKEHGGKKIVFQDINYAFLKKFETYLFDTGCTAGGISVYMRTLRTAYNEAIKEGLVSRNAYPFSTPQNKGYEIGKLKSKPNPKALSISDMDKIKNFPLNQHPHLKNAVLYFLFSYYARGINFRDMAKLKWDDLYNGRINYTRLKTGGFLSIKVSKPMKDIMKAFPKGESPYIFPILDNFHQTPAQVQNRVKKCLKEYNKDLKAVAEVVGIKVPLTSYVARHTYATTLKHKGVDVGIISEGMGHQNVNITKNYLKQFSHEVVDEADEVL